jgi:hypothetical protein
MGAYFCGLGGVLGTMTTTGASFDRIVIFGRLGGFLIAGGSVVGFIGSS